MRGAAPRGLHALLGSRRWSALLDRGVRRVFPPKSMLLRQGDPGTHLLALTQGRVKVLHASPDGSQTLVAIRGHGDVVGEIAAWSPDSHHRPARAAQVPASRASLRRPSARQRTASVEALDRCVAHRIEATAFIRFLDEHDALGMFTEYLLDRIAQAVQHQAILAGQPPPQRIAWLIAETFALSGPEIAHSRRIPFSQAGIASALGLSRSTVAENLRRLRAAGALAPERRIVVADIRALRRLAAG